MPKFSVQVPHTLPQQEARERLGRFAEVLGQKFKDQVSELEQSWEGDTLKFRFKSFGIPLSGGIAVGDSQLDLSGDLPFSAMIFKGKIESAIREQLEKIVGE
jgi:putative polyhydroxyalkanoate system protein